MSDQVGADTAAALIAAHVADTLNHSPPPKPEPLPPPPKRGRKTKAEELAEFAEAVGIDMSLVREFLGGALEPEPTPSTQEIRDELQRLLYERRNELKGIALVQGLKALAALAETEKHDAKPDDEADDRQPLLDRLDALPKDHAAALIKGEMDRLDVLREDYFRALERLQEAV